MITCEFQRLWTVFQGHRGHEEDAQYEETI